MRYVPEQLTSWKMLYVFRVCWLWIITVNEFLGIFVLFESCNLFVLKLFLRDSLIQFFRMILLMFCKNRLHVIDKWCVSFLLPFISLFLSNFSTDLMCYSGSSELYTFSKIVLWAFYSDVQSLLMYNFVWFVVLHCMKYCLLRISDVLNLCNESSADWFVFYIF